jgi:BlaI family penicillinase repressor
MDVYCAKANDMETIAEVLTPDPDSQFPEGQAPPVETECMRIQQAVSQAQGPRLSKLERRVMEVLWTLGKASVREILEAFPAPYPAYTTIQTVVYRLENKSAVRRSRKIGNAHIFEPVIPRDTPADAPQADGRRKELNLLLNLLREAMMRAVEYGDFTPEDVRAVQKILTGHSKQRAA